MSAAEKRGVRTRTIAVNMLMNIWIKPPEKLIPLRDDLINLLQERKDLALMVHWAMISCVYPFWFNIAQITGKLFSLQGRITKQQIMIRLKEQYGDKSTVERCARYAIRSFVSWGILTAISPTGIYDQSSPMAIDHPRLASLFIEAELYALPDHRGPLSLLVNNPALFPFRLPRLSGDSISKNNKRVAMEHYSLGNDYLTLG
jgi:hypothetical protein